MEAEHCLNPKAMLGRLFEKLHIGGEVVLLGAMSLTDTPPAGADMLMYSYLLCSMKSAQGDQTEHTAGLDCNARVCNISKCLVPDGE